MESFRQARETKAEGWRCSFVGPEVPETGNGRGRKRRTRVVKRTRLAKAKAAPKTKSKKNKKNKNKNKKDKKGKSKKQKANKEAKPPIPAVAGNFSRSKKGDKLIQQEMVRLLNLDISEFPDKPAFDPVSGACRLKIDAAKGQTWQKVVDKASLYFHNIYMSRSRSAYGQSVEKHVQTLTKNLEDGNRSPWLKLLRSICEMPDVKT